jgi:hypothetical protein
MQNPTNQAEAEASIPTENVGDDPNGNRIVNVRRKAAKRTVPFDLVEEELHLMPSSSLPRPQAEDVPAPARKKPRMEEPLSTTTVSVSLSVLADTAANVDPTTDTQPNAGANRRWTLEENSKLSHAITNTPKKKWGNEYRLDWDAIAELVPGRTKYQCNAKWHAGTLNPNIDPTTARAGKWSEDEATKLKDAVLTHGDKNWKEIAELVPGRTLLQCRGRWNNSLDRSIDPTTARTGKWIEDEDSKLKDAVQTHGGKDWAAISALIPGRTKSQCCRRWHNTSTRSIALEAGCTGKWSEDEVTKLEDAVRTHGDKNWKEIAALVLDRTSTQCYNKWKKRMDPNRSTVQGKNTALSLNKAPPALG